jgi:hypothetical protein
MNSMSHRELLKARIALACFMLVQSLFASRLAHAQKVASYDYTNTKPTERLRPPVPLPQPVPGQFVAGACGGVLGSPLVAISVLSLDRHTYAFGDGFIFVLQVKALVATQVPVAPSLGELEPGDPTASYEWRSMGISMELTKPNYRSVRVALLTLYGSKEIPGSEVDLKSGEWVEMRGKARMEWTNPPPNLLPPGEEKWVLPLPLKETQEFSAWTFGNRGEGHHFDAKTRQENRVCHSGEQSASGYTVRLTVTPKSIQ